MRSAGVVADTCHAAEGPTLVKADEISHASAKWVARGPRIMAEFAI